MEKLTVDAAKRDGISPTITQAETQIESARPEEVFDTNVALAALMEALQKVNISLRGEFVSVFVAGFNTRRRRSPNRHHAPSTRKG